MIGFELRPPISTLYILNLHAAFKSLKVRRSKLIPQGFIGWPFTSGARRSDAETKQNTAHWDWSSSGVTLSPSRAEGIGADRTTSKANRSVFQLWCGAGHTSAFTSYPKPLPLGVVPPVP